MKHRLDLWKGEFGDAYHARNALDESNIQDRAKWFREVFNHLLPFAPESIFEVGCGNGANLVALESMCNALLRGAEPNARARRNAVRQAPFARIFDDAANRLTLSDREIDLVFTSGVLIHIPDEGLPDAMAEIHRSLSASSCAPSITAAKSRRCRTGARRARCGGGLMGIC